MNLLSSCAQREPKESLTGTDVVTEVKLLPKADSKFKALPSKETQEVFHDSNMESEYNNSDDFSEPQVKKNPLTPIQQRIYDFITHGRIHMMVSFLIIIVLLIIDKSYVRIGTLICKFLGGPIIDVFNFILNQILVPILNMLVRLVLNIRLRNSCLWHDHRH